MSEPIPSIGRIVHYRLSIDDAIQINRRRTSGASIVTRMQSFVPSAQENESVIYGWPDDIEIRDEDAEKLVTVEQAVAMIDKLLAAKASSLPPETPKE